MKIKKQLIPGSKVPISYLLDYIKDGYALSDFTAAYPWVKQSSLKKALNEIKRREFTAGYAV